jgi:enoyl-CoA hydratase/carnithine racemase
LSLVVTVFSLRVLTSLNSVVVRQRKKSVQSFTVPSRHFQEFPEWSSLRSGYALGGGCELALACDYRIASQRAVFGQPEILLGIIPGGGGTQRLARLVGPSRAKELCLSGRQVKAEEALRIGLCDEVVEPDQLMTRALEFAAQLASGAVLAQGMAKAAIDEGLQGTLEAGLARELTLFADVFETEDSQVGVQSFLAHGPGKATFSGR